MGGNSSEELAWELVDIFESAIFPFPIYDHASAREIIRFLRDRGIPNEEIADAIKDSAADLVAWLDQGDKYMVGECIIAWINACRTAYERQKRRQMVCAWCGARMRARRAIFGRQWSLGESDFDDDDDDGCGEPNDSGLCDEEDDERGTGEHEDRDASWTSTDTRGERTTTRSSTGCFSDRSMSLDESTGSLDISKPSETRQCSDIGSNSSPIDSIPCATEVFTPDQMAYFLNASFDILGSIFEKGSRGGGRLQAPRTTTCRSCFDVEHVSHAAMKNCSIRRRPSSEILRDSGILSSADTQSNLDVLELEEQRRPVSCQLFLTPRTTPISETIGDKDVVKLCSCKLPHYIRRCASARQIRSRGESLRPAHYRHSSPQPAQLLRNDAGDNKMRTDNYVAVGNSSDKENKLPCEAVEVCTATLEPPKKIIVKRGGESPMEGGATPVFGRKMKSSDRYGPTSAVGVASGGRRGVTSREKDFRAVSGKKVRWTGDEEDERHSASILSQR